jgi:hypothetical protein
LSKFIPYGFVNIDIETCHEYGGAVKFIACIGDPVVIKKILMHLKEKTTIATTLVADRKFRDHRELKNRKPIFPGYRQWVF